MIAEDCQDPLSLLHSYFVGTHRLDEMNYEVVSLSARDLLRRFDLFSKLFYIRNRKEHPRLARRVYLENLRALVPFGVEWGKENEKNSFSKFIEVFDYLIDLFAVNEFDASVSIVPVDSNDVLIDGAHRVAALAFYGKEVTVCRFERPVYCFDYAYFLERGMSRYVADLTALEAIYWLDDVNVKCIWPLSGGDADIDGEILYVREFSLGGTAYNRLRESIDSSAPSIAEGGRVKFVFFRDSDGIADKERILRIAEIVLSDEGRAGWYSSSRIAYKIAIPYFRLSDKLRAERKFRRFRKMMFPHHLKDYLEKCGNKYLLFLYKKLSPMWVREKYLNESD